MPRPSLRNRNKKRRLLRLPGGRKEIHYGPKKGDFSKCAGCGGVLSGVPKLTASKLRKLPANRRRPDRMYGGRLCHLCLKELLKLEVRGI